MFHLLGKGLADDAAGMAVQHLLEYLSFISHEGELIRVGFHLPNSSEVLLRVGPRLVAGASAYHFVNNVPIFAEKT